MLMIKVMFFLKNRRRKPDVFFIHNFYNLLPFLGGAAVLKAQRVHLRAVKPILLITFIILQSSCHQDICSSF